MAVQAIENQNNCYLIHESSAVQNAIGKPYFEVQYCKIHEQHLCADFDPPILSHKS